MQSVGEKGIAKAAILGDWWEKTKCSLSYYQPSIIDEVVHHRISRIVFLSYQNVLPTRHLIGFFVSRWTKRPWGIYPSETNNTVHALAQSRPSTLPLNSPHRLNPLITSSNTSIAFSLSPSATLLSASTAFNSSSSSAIRASCAA